MVKLTSQGYTTALSSIGGGHNQAVLTGPDGRVWIATETELDVYDPQTDQISATSHAGGVFAMTVSQGAVWALRTDRRTVDQLGTNGASTRAVTLGTTTVTGHWLQATDQP